MAAHKQTQGAFKNDVIDRLGTDRPELSKADINAVINAIVEESESSLASGYEVPLFGLVTIVPVAKSGRKKGTVVRNPFDGTETTIKKDEADKIRLSARPRANAKNALPTGKNLAALVAEIR